MGGKSRKSGPVSKKLVQRLIAEQKKKGIQIKGTTNAREEKEEENDDELESTGLGIV